MNETIVSMRLIGAHSQYRGFCLNASIPRAIFRVGSAIECNWRIEGPGIAAHHLMLLWNGQSLTVVDVGAGDLWVDNEAFCLSTIVNFGQIAFGSALILVEQLVEVHPQSTDDTIVCRSPFETEMEDTAPIEKGLPYGSPQQW